MREEYRGYVITVDEHISNEKYPSKHNGIAIKKGFEDKYSFIDYSLIPDEIMCFIFDPEDMSKLTSYKFDEKDIIKYLKEDIDNWEDL